jgi:hypothetical protein
MHLYSTIMHEENASALPMVLIVLTVLLTLVGTVMAVYRVQHQFMQQDIREMQAYHTAEGGLHYAQGQLQQNADWRPSQQLYPCASEERTCTLAMEPYGGYWRVAARADEGARSAVLQAFIGTRPTAAFRQAVVLTDAQSDLTLAGDTRIQGDVYNAWGRVQNAPLGQTPFTGSFDGSAYEVNTQTEPVFTGYVVQSTLVRLHELLILPPSQARPIAGALAAGAPVAGAPAAEGLIPEGGIAEESISQGARADDRSTVPSFHPQYIVAEGNTVLTAADTSITRHQSVVIVRGNLTIQGPLHLHDTSQFIVRDTLFVREGTGRGEVENPAPNTSGSEAAGGPFPAESAVPGRGVSGTRALFYGGKHVELSNWSGDAQVLSGGGITLGGHTALTYPSLVYVGKRTASLAIDEQGARPIEAPESLRHIDIQGEAAIDGTVILNRTDQGDDSFSYRDERVQIGPQARIRGAVYSNTVTTLQGHVSGTVATRQFYVYRSPTDYINWISSGTISVRERPEPYVMPVGFRESPNDNMALVHLSDEILSDEIPLASSNE